MASDLFWHVPRWYDSVTTPTAVTGDVFSNVGVNAFAELVETDTASQNLSPDNYWVERIVGQVYYQRLSTEPDSKTWYLHTRVYVTQASNTGIVLRDLTLADDADTSWMMHKVEVMFDSQTTSVGNWGQPDTGNTADTYTPPMSRKGSFDIKVGRKVSEGESLVWHNQIKAEVEADLIDGTLRVKMWCRVLLRQL